MVGVMVVSYPMRTMLNKLGRSVNIFFICETFIICMLLTFVYYLVVYRIRVEVNHGLEVLLRILWIRCRAVVLGVHPQNGPILLLI